METYYRIGDAAESKDLHNLKEELEDRFGNIPIEVKWLLAFAEIRIVAGNLHITRLKIGKLTFLVDFF